MVSSKYEVSSVLVFLLCINCGYGLYDHGRELYSEDGLPPLFKHEDYFNCEKQNGTFCKIEAFITPKDLNSRLAKEIKKSHEAHYRYHRSSIHRLMCIPKENISKLMDINYMRRAIEEELRDYNVTVEISHYHCNVNQSFSTYDLLLGVFALAYYFTTFSATAYDIISRKKPRSSTPKYEKYLKIFSIRDNWKKINARNANPDFQKLKSIQGIRFFNNLLIISLHTNIYFLMLFFDNPQALEKTYHNKFIRNKWQMDLFLIQIFLMISTFLLTNQIYELHQKNGYFSLTHCFMQYVNRIFRFLPTMSLGVLFVFPLLKILPQGTMVLDIIDVVRDNCRNFGWATILQLNFLIPFSKMCMLGIWYISVDMVLYVTTIIILYVQLKYKLDLKKVLIITFIGTTFNYAYTIYSENLDIKCRPYLEAMKKFYISSDVQALYISPTSNLNTCCVGIALGAIYFHTKNKNIKINPILQKIWLAVFLLLPVLVIYVSNYEYHGISRAIIGPLLKPLFTLGFGIGILGMSNGLGGIIKTILESNFAVKMGNFSYCTYLLSLLVLLIRVALYRGLVHYNSLNFIIALIQDVTLSFLLGPFMTVTVEYPGLRIQKMYIPQIKVPEYKKNEKKFTNNRGKIE